MIESNSLKIRVAFMHKNIRPSHSFVILCSYAVRSMIPIGKRCFAVWWDKTSPVSFFFSMSLFLHNALILTRLTHFLAKIHFDLRSEAFSNHPIISFQFQSVIIHHKCIKFNTQCTIFCFLLRNNDDDELLHFFLCSHSNTNSSCTS